MTLDALYITAPRTTEIRRVELDAPGPGEVQLEVKACGVCAWDAYLFKGQDPLQPFPFRFGHEAAGLVTKLGANVTDLSVGDRVFCIDGGPAMAQHIDIRRALVGRLPGEPGTPEEFAPYVGEPAVCVVSGLANITLAPGDRVVVIGAGYMGLLNVQLFNRCPVGSLACFDLDEHKLALAREFGADVVYRSGTGEGERAAQAIIDAGGADLVVECSASEAGLRLAQRLLRAGAPSPTSRGTGARAPSTPRAGTSGACASSTPARPSAPTLPTTCPRPSG